MFHQTFVDAASSSKKPITIAFSLVLQGSLVCLLILIRLLGIEVLPEVATKSFLVAPAAPVKVIPEAHSSKTQPKLVARILDTKKLTAPIAVPQKILSSISTTPVPEVAVIGDTGDTNASTLLGAIHLPGSVPQASIPPREIQPHPQLAHQAVLVGGRVAEANLIYKVLPVYSQIARSARVQGTVEFTARISKEGRVEHLQLVHGHPLLVKAAQEAVRQWRYRPTTLNGEAVEVMTNIVVNFTLAQ